MDPLVFLVFVVVYLGMIAGGIPGLALDRTGVALLGAIVLVTAERLTPTEAWTAIDTPTMGLLLTSRRMQSREMLQLIDWQLLVLFAGLFIVNRAMAASGNLQQIMADLLAVGIDPAKPAWLFGTSVVLSNLVSNVPATMLLLLPTAHHSLAGPILALSSTLAGNLLVVGSIANIIVIDQAARLGIRISWREHALVGVPVTILTLALAAVWLVILANGGR